jgi:predicted DsbA family dithiol-disulfide isomerase
MSCTDGIKVVDEATALSYKLGIASLPTFFLETGQCISGAKMSVLEKALKH